MEITISTKDDFALGALEWSENVVVWKGRLMWITRKPLGLIGIDNGRKQDGIDSTTRVYRVKSISVEV